MSATTNQDQNIKNWTELVVILCFYFSVLLAFLLSLQQFSIDWEHKTYDLTFKDDLTTFNTDNARVSFTLHNNQSYSHLLKIYGLNTLSNGTETIFSISDLSSQEGGKIDQDNVKLYPKTIPFVNNTVLDSENVTLSILNSREAGTFNGWLLLSNGQKIISIPLKASTQPLLFVAIGWVVVGAAVSIGLWEIIRYLNTKKSEAEENDLEQEFNDLSKQVKESSDSVENLKSRVGKLERLVEKVVSSTKDSRTFAEDLKVNASKIMSKGLSVDLNSLEEKDNSQHEIQDLDSLISMATEAATKAIDTEEKMKRNKDEYTIGTILQSQVNAAEIIGNVTMASSNADLAKKLYPIIKEKSKAKVVEETQKQTKLQAMADVNRTAAATVKTKIVSAKERVANNTQRSRIAIIDIASAGFGITVALIGVLNNALVTNLQAIGNLELLTLLGIGLGAGSLKEIVDRS